MADWPPAKGVTTVHVSRESMAIALTGRVLIDAPAELVWDVLRNTAEWPKWGKTIVAGKITSQPQNTDLGSEKAAFLYHETAFTITMDVGTFGMMDFPQRISDFSPSGRPSGYVSQEMLGTDGSFYNGPKPVWRIAWVTEDPSLGDAWITERFNEIIDLGEGNGSEYRTWEGQSGPVAEMGKEKYGDLLTGMLQSISNELKHACETAVAAKT